MNAAISLEAIAAEIAAASARVDLYNWLIVLLGILLPVPLSYFPKIRQAYYQWRLDRQLARDPVIYQDGLPDYQHRIGEDLEDIDWRHILWTGAANGAFIALFFVIAELETSWARYAAFLIMLIGFGFGFREHYQNHETRGEEGYAPQPAEFPLEAILGLLGGLLLVFAIVMFAVSIF